MPLLIDGVLQDEGSANATLRSRTLQAIQGTQQQGKYIRTLLINGEEASVKLLGTQDLGMHDEVSIVTCSLDELIEDTMTSAREYTPALIHALVSSVSMLRTGNLGEASGIVAEAISGLEWTVDVLQNLSGFHPGPSPIHELYEQSKQIVPELFRAWEDKDFVLSADLLEYEIAPMLEKWLYVAEVFTSQMRAERLQQGIFQNQ